MRPDPSNAQSMTPEAFATLGVEGVAYVRRILEKADRKGGEPIAVYAIHAADGERIGGAPSRDLAFAAIRQHGMEPIDAN